MPLPALPPTLPEVTVVAAPYTMPAISTATRTDTLLRDIPQSITVITREQIRDQSMQSMADAIRTMPGIGAAQGEGNRDTAIFRGNSSSADFYVDGLRDDVQYYRDFYNIDSIEALKGPNAMLFGRGGSGGVINRSTKQASGRDAGTATLTVGSWNQRRATVDVQRMLQPFALRVNAMAEQADSYRDGVDSRRAGIHPTFLLRPGAASTVTFGYEHFRDQRTADRGIPSWHGRPVATAGATFFGAADASYSRARVDAFNFGIEHSFDNGTRLRNRTRYAEYDKAYQNVFPGAVNAAGTQVAVSAYSNATRRENFFNQVELQVEWRAGAALHQLVSGIDIGVQHTGNYRQTGYFNGAASVNVALADPTVRQPVLFRQSVSDADNQGKADNAAWFVQDQVEFGPHWLAIVGLRHERLAVDFHNRRTGARLRQVDTPLAPRAGIVARPVDRLSLYGSYSIAYLPRAGEQLASLTPGNQAFDPERFRNLEIGMKWELRPGLGLTAALYRLERSNVVIPDPADPSKSVLADGQRSKGAEFGLAGRLAPGWNITGGYAWQDARLTRSQSVTALAGARLAQVPGHSLSFWNRVGLPGAVDAAVGLVGRSAVFTSTSNSVRLPGFARVDAALFYRLSPKVRVQLNIENLLDRQYYASAHSNDNITPGAPRNLRLSLDASL